MKVSLAHPVHVFAVLCLVANAGSYAAEKPTPAIAPPVTAELLSFTPKSPGKDGGFVYRLENRSTKTVAQIVLDMEFRDADGVLEKRVPSTLAKELRARAKTKEEEGGFFLTETVRKVSFVVQTITFADGTKWSARHAALAASAPGKLTFAGHETPASVELMRFRPKNEARNGGVAWRLMNHSNKAIEGFVLNFAYRDAAGKVEKEAPLTVRSGDGIAPNGTFEGSESEFFLGDGTRSVDLSVKSITFVGGEKWEATNKN